MSDTTEQTNEKAKEMRRFIGRLAYYATPIYRSLQERNQEDEWFPPLTRFMLDVILRFQSRGVFECINLHASY